MEKFTRTLHGYNPDEVNEFLDNIISQVEQIVNSNKEKNKEIRKLKEALENNSVNPEILAKAKKYDELCDTLNKAINIAQNTSEHIRRVAKKERSLILEDAKKNGEIIVKNALDKSHKIEHQAELLKRNIILFKRKIKTNLNEQLKLIDEIDILN